MCKTGCSPPSSAPCPAFAPPPVMNTCSSGSALPLQPSAAPRTSPPASAPHGRERQPEKHERLFVEFIAGILLRDWLRQGGGHFTSCKASSSSRARRFWANSSVLVSLSSRSNSSRSNADMTTLGCAETVWHQEHFQFYWYNKETKKILLRHRSPQGHTNPASSSCAAGHCNTMCQVSLSVID